MDEVELRQRIEVVAIYRKEVADNQLCMPVRMRYQGREITFSELGLRHPTWRGKRMIHVFDMTDGNTDFRLEFDAERLVWHLVGMKAIFG